jgi:hypothetical protein
MDRRHRPPPCVARPALRRGREPALQRSPDPPLADKHYKSTAFGWARYFDPAVPGRAARAAGSWHIDGSPILHGGDRSASARCTSLTLVKRNRAFGARSGHLGPTFAVFGAGRLHFLQTSLAPDLIPPTPKNAVPHQETADGLASWGRAPLRRQWGTQHRYRKQPGPQGELATCFTPSAPRGEPCAGAERSQASPKCPAPKRDWLDGRQYRGLGRVPRAPARRASPSGGVRRR